MCEDEDNERQIASDDPKASLKSKLVEPEVSFDRVGAASTFDLRPQQGDENERSCDKDPEML